MMPRTSIVLCRLLIALLFSLVGDPAFADEVEPLLSEAIAQQADPTLAEVPTGSADLMLTEARSLFDMPDAFLGKEVYLQDARVLCPERDRCLLTSAQDPTKFIDARIGNLDILAQERLESACNRSLCAEFMRGKLTSSGFEVFDALEVSSRQTLSTQDDRTAGDPWVHRPFFIQTWDKLLPGGGEPRT